MYTFVSNTSGLSSCLCYYVCYFAYVFVLDFVYPISSVYCLCSSYLAMTINLNVTEVRTWRLWVSQAINGVQVFKSCISLVSMCADNQYIASYTGPRPDFHCMQYGVLQVMRSWMRINTCIIHAQLDNLHVVCASHKGITSHI